MELIKLPLSDFQKQAVQHTCGVGADYTHVVSLYSSQLQAPRLTRNIHFYHLLDQVTSHTGYH